MKKRLLYLSLIILFITCVIFLFFKTTRVSKEVKVNKGLFNPIVDGIIRDTEYEQDSKAIYYINKSDNNSIYALSYDGSSNIKLNNASSSDLESMNGWIYFINKDEQSYIYKIKDDGSNQTRLTQDTAENLVLSPHFSDDLFIYFVNKTDNSKIYRIKEDGTSKVRITEDSCITPLKDDKTGAFKFIYYNSYPYNEEWIIYKSGYDKSLCRINIDGSNKTKIIDGIIDYLIIKDIDIQNPKIYFIDKVNKKLFQAYLESGQEYAPIKSNSENFVYQREWIYFVDDFKLFKIKNDGAERLLLANEYAQKINYIENEWIYYGAEFNNKGQHNYTKTELFFKVKTDGTNKTFIKGTQSGYINDKTFTKKVKTLDNLKFYYN